MIPENVQKELESAGAARVSVGWPVPQLYLEIFFRVGSYAFKTLAELLHVDAVNYPVVNNNMEGHYSSGGKTAVFYMGLFDDAAGMNSDGNSYGCNNGLEHNKVCGYFVVHMV